MKNISPKTKISRNPSQLFSIIDGEVVMLNAKKGTYHALNEVGSAIWNELSSPIYLNELVKQLTLIYDTSEETCLNDIKPFLQKLDKEKVIHIINE